MPKFKFTLIAILRELEDGLILAEAPGFPEVSRLGDDPESVLDALAEERGGLSRPTSPWSGIAAVRSGRPRSARWC